MRKLISIMLILAALVLTGCGKKQENEEVKSDAPVVNQEQKQEEKQEQPKNEEKKEEEQQPAKKEEKAEGQQPPVLETDGEDLEEMINKFNELEDGDPEKEELRTKLEQIFASVE